MNWMRLNETRTEFAIARASCVLPVPGLSSRRMWPPATSAVTHWRIGDSLPTTTCETLSTIAEKCFLNVAISSFVACPVSATAPIGGSVCAVDVMTLPSRGGRVADVARDGDAVAGDAVTGGVTTGGVVTGAAAVARIVPSSTSVLMSASSAVPVVCVCSNISRVGRSGMTTCGTDGVGDAASFADGDARTVSSAVAAADCSTADSCAPARTVSSAISCFASSLLFVICWLLHVGCRDGLDCVGRSWVDG